MLKLFQWLLLFASVFITARTFSLSHDPERLSSGLSSRVHAPRLEARDGRGDMRLPLPSPQELEAIKKVAQILVMLGEQVIPTIIGDSPGKGATTRAPEVPNDPVQTN